MQKLRCRVSVRFSVSRNTEEALRWGQQRWSSCVQREGTLVRLLSSKGNWVTRKHQKQLLVPVPNFLHKSAQHRDGCFFHAWTWPFELFALPINFCKSFFPSQISFKQQSASPVDLFSIPDPRSVPATGWTQKCGSLWNLAHHDDFREDQSFRLCFFPLRLKLFHRTEGATGSIGAPVVTEWRHYAVVYNGGAVRAYRDGAEFGSYPLSSRSGGTYGVGNGEFQIRRTYAGWSSVHGLGGIGDIARFPKHIKGKQRLMQLGVGPQPIWLTPDQMACHNVNCLKIPWRQLCWNWNTPTTPTPTTLGVDSVTIPLVS